MKILVFDDSPVHRQAANLSLEGHDLTVVGTYDEAQKALVPILDYDKKEKIQKKLMVEAGLASDFSPTKPWDEKKAKDWIEPSAEDKAKYEEVRNKARDLATTYPDFDIVLTDLLVPASRQAQGGEGTKFVGQEMPLGTTIALLALVAGVKKVAVVTDMNHHSHPASAAFDCFSGLNMPGANIICTNRVGGVAIDEETGKLVDTKFLHDEKGQNTAKGLKKYPYVDSDNWGPRKGLGYGKDWGSILKQFLGEEVAE